MGRRWTRFTAWVRRHPIWVGVLLLLVVAVRVALPYIVRAQLEKQANATVAGQVTIGDVDLALLRGGVALEDVALRGENAPADNPPMVAFRRFYVQLGYFALLRRRIRIEDLSLDGLATFVERNKDGTVVLPTLRPTPAAEPPPPPPEPSPPWDIIVDQADLHAGRLHVRDHVADPAQDVDLGLPALYLSRFRLLHAEDAGRGVGAIRLQFADGTVAIGTKTTPRADGMVVDVRVDARNLPLDRTQRHVPQLGWSSLAGRLDALLRLRQEPGKGPTAAGTIALRDLRIEVPGETDAALAWRRLDIDIGHLDVIGREARVERVALDGAGVIIKPREPAALPLLAGVQGQAAPEAVPPPDATPPPDAAPKDGAAGAPWKWHVGTVELTDSIAKIFLEPPPLEIGAVRILVSGLDSKPGSEAQLKADIAVADGTINFEGGFTLDPLGATIQSRFQGVTGGPFVAAVGPVVPVQLPRGALSGSLKNEFRPAPLVVSGEIALDDLAVASAAGEDFGLGWKRLEVGIREVRVPNIMPADKDAPKQPVKVDLERVRLVKPAITVTRTEAGLVLPTSPSDGKAPAEAEPPPPPPPAEPATAAGPPPVELALGTFELDDGTVTVVDRSVKPFYRGKLSELNVRAHGLKVPENVFQDFSLATKLPAGGSLTVSGKQSRNDIRVELNQKQLPLSQFNPYVKQAAGYSISRGTFSLNSNLRWTGTAYDSTSKIEFDKLGVGGAQGESLFSQRFGMSLTVALGLLTDVNGKIKLQVPVRGDRERGMQIDYGAIVADALAHALVNALMSPLKLLGAFSLDGTKVTDFTPKPIEFRPGLALPAAAAKEQLERIGTVMGSAPALALTLTGSAGSADVRALQEAAVLADLQGEGAVMGGLRNLASRGGRGAIRKVLEARAKGEDAELPADQQKTLDELADAKKVDDGALNKLAAARAEKIKADLVAQHGIDGGRVTLGEVAVDRAAGSAAVAIGVGT
jgi:hypothetical protein